MHEPPGTVAEAAQRRELGRLVLTNRKNQDSIVALVILFGGIGAGLILVPSVTDSLAAAIMLVVVLVLLVVSAMAGAQHVRNLLRPPPVLYVFQRGAVLREGDGRVCVYPWPRVRTRTHRSPDMIPWGTGETFLHLSGDDGRHLGTFGTTDERQIIRTLMSGPADGRR